MNVDVEKIREAIDEVIDDMNSMSAEEIPIQRAGDAILFGHNGSLDSLRLVHFIVAVEQEIAQTFDIQITLASDDAMSRQRSPFRTIDGLIEYIVALIRKQEKTDA